MAELSVTVTGVEELLAKLASVRDNLRRDVGAALYQEAELIMTDSKENYVPVDTGALKSSGHVEKPAYDGDQVSVRLGYGGPAAPYALAVHENPRAGKTGGVNPSGTQRKTWSEVGSWKYLEFPFLQAARDIKERIAARLRMR